MTPPSQSYLLLLVFVFISRAFTSPLDSDIHLRVKRDELQAEIADDTQNNEQENAVVPPAKHTPEEVVPSDSSSLQSVTASSITTTAASFQVERLDAPMERIEIRLIDENNTKTHEEGEEAHAARPEPEQALLQPRASESTKATDEPGSDTGSNDIHERYRKIEYDVQPTEAINATKTMEATTNDANEVVQQTTANQDEHNRNAVGTVDEDPSSDLPLTSPQPAPVGQVDNYYSSSSSQASHEHGQQTAEAKMWLSLSTAMPTESEFNGDIDEGDLPPIPAQSDAQNEPEPVEACLANSDKLSEAVVEKLKEETARLYRVVKQMNEQQSQYCKENDKTQRMNDEYRNCASWREEKMVHYYKLMRKTYCQDVNQWPNSPKVKRTYGKYLQLFGTLYAFQK